MPRRSKGPRLYWHPSDATWIIRDGPIYLRTGCGGNETKQAEEKLAEYIATKHSPAIGERRQSHLHCADVIAFYVEKKLTDKKTVHRQNELIAQGERLNAFFGGITLRQINGDTCDRYTAQSSTQSMARHDLEILRAAINLWDKKFNLDHCPKITLPEKSEPRSRHMTRKQAAKLLWAAHRAGNRHLVRFILISLYTGTRPSALFEMQWMPSTSGGWFDLDRGIMYRIGEGQKQSKKRRTPAVIPNKLMPWLRRWKAQDTAGEGIIRHVVHWNGRKVSSVKKAFRNAVVSAELPDWVIPYILRHTAITWAMNAGKRPSTVAEFFGVTMKVIEAHYWQHHPDYQQEMRKA